MRQSSAIHLGPSVLALLLFGCGGVPTFPAAEPPTEPPACVVADPPAPRALPKETLARELADAWMQRHAPESMHWDWGPAVLAYGLLDLYDATGDSRYRTYVRSWIDHHAEAPPIFWSDTAAPAAAAARLARYSCETSLLQISDRTTTYILDGAPRTEAGGIAHLGYLLPEHPQLWVDSLFMFGSVLLHRGETRQQPQLWDAFADQVRIFSDELQDGSGWFRHALLHEAPFPEEEVFWARGNGWITSIVPRLLDRLADDHPLRQRIEQSLTRLLTAVAATQDDSGLWWTVVNRPGETYLEPSAAALFADGLRRGANLGLIPDAVAETAYAETVSAIETKIAPHPDDGLPTLYGTSTGTQPSTFPGYAAVPQTHDVDYGIGAVLLLLTSPQP